MFTKLWDDFWKDFPENPDEIENIENVIFRNKYGVWVMAILPPNEEKPIVVRVDYNPWTGEKLI